MPAWYRLLGQSRLVGQIFALLAVLLSAGCQRATPPNIILYVVDTLRADALHCDGNSGVQTPASDALANDGTRFTRAYAAASWTRASMGSLLTGEYPSTHGAVGRADALHSAIPTLASRLHAAGYYTAALIANPNVGTPFGFAAGFNDFVELYTPHAQPTLVKPEELIAPADRVVDRTIDWLRSRKSSPFFLLVFSIDPHAPYTPPPPYNAMYDPDYAGAVDGSLQSIWNLAISHPVPPEREIRHLRALYHGEVTFNDAQLGRLLAEIDRLNLRSTTLVVLTSDHGEEFYEHGSRDHGHTLYEELIHVPLIVRWPGHIPAGRALPAVVQLPDLYPTLLHLAGTPGGQADAVGAGRDLSALFLGAEPGTAPGLAYAEEDLDGHVLQALILGQNKAIWDAARPPPLNFDLSRDPGELHPQPGSPPALFAQHLAAIQARNHPPGSAPARTINPTELPESVRKAMEALGYGDPAKNP